MNFSLTHRFHDCLEVGYQGRPLFRYVYRPQTNPMESPRPYFHPLVTLAGDEVTCFRPYDHVWHKGLSMTMAQLSGQNFWGGPTYVRDQGYIQLPNNGRMEHEGWNELRCEQGGIVLGEKLAWITYSGERWIDEERQVEVTEVNPAGGYWSLDLSFRLRNVRGEHLVFGSPTTEGRPLAGYGGLFWRGPRSFLRGAILAAGGLEGPEVMGKAAAWLAYVGRHDGNTHDSTLLFLDHPDNLRHPTQWFVRNEPYGCASCAFSFDREYTLEPDAVLALRYRVVLGNGAWSRQQLDDYAHTLWRR